MSNPVLPHALRGETPAQGFAIVTLSALGCGALAAYVSDARPPGLGEIVLGILPFAFLMVAVVTFVSMRFFRERLRTAIDLGVEATLIGLLLSAIATATGWFTDGTTESVLAASDAGKMILTGGVFPLHIGPSAAIRFLPICAAIFVASYAKRRATVVPLILSVGIVYLLPFVALLSTTISGVLSAQMHGFSTHDASSLFKTLVTAHADGYWTAAQGDRFLLPVARQAENALLGFRAATALLLGGLLMVLGSVGSSATTGLVKRLAAPESVQVYIVALAGLALGTASASSSSSHATVVSLVLGTTVLFAWSAALRFRQDLVDLPRHEREHPEYPLPSGAIQSQDLEAVIISLVGFSLIGSVVLGYPVFVALLTATLCARLSEDGETRAPAWHSVFLSAVLLLALAEAGGLIGSRALAVPGWVSRTFLALASVSVLGALFRRYALELESRAVGVVAALLGFVAIAALSNQLIFWVIAVLATVALAFSARTPGKWHRIAPWVFDAAIGLVALCSLIVPQFFRRF